MVTQVLAQSGLKAESLELENTESVLMSNPKKVIEVLGDLRSLGVSLVVDDFGTGYSSLSYLKHPDQHIEDKSSCRHRGTFCFVQCLISGHYFRTLKKILDVNFSLPETKKPD